MRRDLVRAARVLALPTAALIIVAVLAPGRLELAARIYSLVVTGAAAVLLLAQLRRSLPRSGSPRRRRARRDGRRPEPPERLDRLEHEVALGIAGAFELHYRLRPHLRDLARELLAARRHISLDDEPERSRAVLGERAWELLRPERSPPADRLARGLPINELRSVVESLERL